MHFYPFLKRWLAAACTAGVFAGVIAVVAWSDRAAGPAKETAKEGGATDHRWPMFGGTLERNMLNTFEKNMPIAWDVRSGKNIKWTTELGSKAYGGPIIVGGKIFIGTNNQRPRNPQIKGDKGVIMCFRESDGGFLWQAVHDKLSAGRVMDWPLEGICSSPVVEGNRLYYVSNRCEVICADVEGFLDGKNDGVQDEKYTSKADADIIWRLDMIRELGVFPHNLATCSPLLVGDALFVVTSNGVDEDHINIPKPKAPSFVAVNKKTGKLIWKDASPGLNIMHGQWSNPAYVEIGDKPQVIFPGGDGWLYSLEPATGKLIWKFDCNPKASIYKLGGKGTKSDFIATPVVYDGKLYIGVGQDPEHDEGVGHYWCIDLEKAAHIGGDVSPVKDNFDPKAAANKNSALVWHFGGMIEPRPEEGREYSFGRTMSTACVHNGLAYISEQEGILHCLNAKTGEKYWDHDMEAATWSSPFGVDGKVYMGNDKGVILIFEQGKKKNLLAEINMSKSVRATPTAANGVLYIMTENKLYAVSQR